MPHRKHTLVITPDARRQLAGILGYTRARWGEAQHDRYRSQFLRAWDELRRYPEIGVAQTDLFLGCRSLVVGSHVVYYEVVARTVYVLRIYHGAEDSPAKLKRLLEESSHTDES